MLQQNSPKAGLGHSDFLDLIYADDITVTIRAESFTELGRRAALNLQWIENILRTLGLVPNVLKTVNMVCDPGNLPHGIYRRNGKKGNASTKQRLKKQYQQMAERDFSKLEFDPFDDEHGWEYEAGAQTGRSPIPLT